MGKKGYSRAQLSRRPPPLAADCFLKCFAIEPPKMLRVIVILVKLMHSPMQVGIHLVIHGWCSNQQWALKRHTPAVHTCNLNIASCEWSCHYYYIQLLLPILLLKFVNDTRQAAPSCQMTASQPVRLICLPGKKSDWLTFFIDKILWENAMFWFVFGKKRLQEDRESFPFFSDMKWFLYHAAFTKGLLVGKQITDYGVNEFDRVCC